MRIARAVLLRIALAAIVASTLGCTDFHARVDARLARDEGLWSRLEGPRYAIHGPNESAEASLSFEANSAMVARGLELNRPEMTRVSLDEAADLHLTLDYRLIDRGAGVESYPDYGPRLGLSFGYGPGWYHGYHAHYSTRTVHLGYTHLVSLSAWLPDVNEPANRRVVWEGYAEHTSDRRSLKQTMPYLIVSLLNYYGQATDEPVRVTLDDDDARVGEVARGGGFGEPGNESAN